MMVVEDLLEERTLGKIEEPGMGSVLCVVQCRMLDSRPSQIRVDTAESERVRAPEVQYCTRCDCGSDKLE